MKKITQVAEGAYFVPSYFEQTVVAFQPAIFTQTLVAVGHTEVEVFLEDEHDRDDYDKPMREVDHPLEPQPTKRR